MKRRIRGRLRHGCRKRRRNGTLARGNTSRKRHIIATFSRRDCRRERTHRESRRGIQCEIGRSNPGRRCRCRREWRSWRSARTLIPRRCDQRRQLGGWQRHKTRILRGNGRLEESRTDAVDLKHRHSGLATTQGILDQRRRQRDRLFGRQCAATNKFWWQVANDVADGQRHVGGGRCWEAERRKSTRRVDRRSLHGLVSRSLEKRRARRLKRRRRSRRGQSRGSLHGSGYGIETGMSASCLMAILSEWPRHYLLPASLGLGAVLKQVSEGKAHR